MSNCNNCYNGCAEIVSDQCVKYTGIDIPELGIQNGDPLTQVEQQITTFLVGTLDGTGINLTIDPNIICNLVNQYLPVCAQCTTITLLDIVIALIKAACDLQEQVDAVVAELATLNADYDVNCLSGVTNSSDTHAVLQAVIDKVCQLEIDLAALALDLDTNYVKLADLNTLIAAYLASLAPVTQQYQKMVPYTVVEYYGPLTNFDAGGVGIAGLGWDKVYLCNGANGTPDKRGRLPVGVTFVPGGGAYNAAVDPGIAGNPNYTLSLTQGQNTVTLSGTQIPAHTHAASVVVTDPGHFHTITNQSDNDFGSGKVAVGGNVPEGTNPVTDSATTGITVAVTNASFGGGQSHTNIPPVIACYYIMYIP
jgi:microcystin-dependent protein/limonene-1,2-epoxide hydrolase